MERTRIYNRARGAAALSLMVPAMLAGTAEIAHARSSEQSVDTFTIYGGENNPDHQFVSVYQDFGGTNKYLNELNIRQDIQNARRLADSKLAINLVISTPKGSFNLSAKLDRSVEAPMHDIHLVPSQEAAEDDSRQAYPDTGYSCGFEWNNKNDFGTTYLCGWNNSEETYVIPAGNKASAFGSKLNLDVQNLATEVGRNMIEVDFGGLNQLNPIFGGQANGKEFLEVSEAAQEAVASSLGVAVAAKTAGLSYDQYAESLNAPPLNTVLDEPPKLSLNIAYPVIPLRFWNSLTPNQTLPVA